MKKCFGGGKKDKEKPDRLKDALRVDQKSVSQDVKLLLIGDMGTGKTALMIRYCDGKFVETDTTGTKHVVEPDMRDKVISVDGTNTKVQIRDTAGTERFRTISASFYRDINGVLVVFSLSDRDSFLSCRTTWCREVDRYAPESALRFLIGNKSDLPRAVDQARAQSLAEEFDMEYFEVSAKDNTNVDNAFLTLLKSIKDKAVGKGVGLD